MHIWMMIDSCLKHIETIWVILMVFEIQFKVSKTQKKNSHSQFR